jgi:dTDP-4-dehydrorhamnose 3,5-epimerase
VGTVNLDQIIVTPLKRIAVSGGDVLHALKCSDSGYQCFGEAYFSIIEHGVIKAWKMHREMTLNLIVPVGEVRFVFVSSDFKQRREECIGIANYARLTVPPGIWFGFEGLASPSSMLLNIANIIHDPNELERIDIPEFKQKFN